ncbi:MAG TPA: hypothetical protein VHI12_01820 [Gaiellaceae bacterium]|nr:hypothetical protein [Gaiellaceae bacterium]
MTVCEFCDPELRPGQRGQIGHGLGVLDPCGVSIGGAVKGRLGKAPALAAVEGAGQLEFDEVALRSSLLPKLSRA